MSLWIKICGNTSLEDARLAAEAGAEAVGFVLAPSPRRVTPVQVAAITPCLPAALEKIGVFVDASFEEISTAIEVGGLTGAQLHFDAAPTLAAQLRARFGPMLRILRVVHFRAAEPAAHRHEADPAFDAILVDSGSAKAAGGTGVSFDWSLARDTLFQKAQALKLIAAGGLTPENVAEAIAALQPWGVDVVSGVEFALGCKEPGKVRAFIANARAVQM